MPIMHPKFTVALIDGRPEIFRDGIYLDHMTRDKLLAVYKRDALRGDWWAEIAQHRATELEQAMEQTR